MLGENVINNVPVKEKGFIETFINVFMKRNDSNNVTFQEVVEFDSKSSTAGKNTALYQRVMSTVHKIVVPEFA